MDRGGTKTRTSPNQPKAGDPTTSNEGLTFPLSHLPHDLHSHFNTSTLATSTSSQGDSKQPPPPPPPPPPPRE
ncbi:hypothetical protein DL98DRAFT_249544 [Cadophora sp. DSE1049]|nr:hypothetical protein DL98DRAFT_249544 [Cadophora sp. DSE1049]